MGDILPVYCSSHCLSGFGAKFQLGVLYHTPTSFYLNLNFPSVATYKSLEFSQNLKFLSHPATIDDVLFFDHMFVCLLDRLHKNN